MLDCDNPFWKFSLAVYAAPGVAAECLTLQRALNIDVNVLLFATWLGSAHTIKLADGNFRTINNGIQSWHETVVRRLRTVRQDIKTMPAMTDDAVKNLRTDIARAELRAEQIEQAMLFELTPDLIDGPAATTIAEAVRHNVAFYLRHGTEPVQAGTEPPNAPRLIEEAIAYRPAVTHP